MRKFVKPKVVISKCIELEQVRWNGQIISSDFVKKLMPHVDSVPVCPEIEIGLGVPRDPIRIVSVNGELRLIQPATNLDVTNKMRSFINSFLDSLPEVDGFILKSRSPTSAIKDAKVYSGTQRAAAVISKGPGFFGSAVLKRFPDLAIEDEGRLRNPQIKEHFLRKLFTLASFREVKASKTAKKLVRFHAENKLLVKAYSQKELTMMDSIMANKEKKPLTEIISDYKSHLFKVFKRPPRCGSNINVMMDVMGNFSEELSKDEKSFFLGSLEDYKAGKLPFSVNTTILKSWVVRFQRDYLIRQTFFEPYPEELRDIDAMTIYCDGKDYWP